MNWKVCEASFGDIIRIKLGSIYHYGIFVSNEEIIQFGLPPTLRSGIPDSEVEVLSTDINTFRCGGFPEVSVFTFKEKLQRISPKKTVALARSRIGEKGYQILYNNCEHFVNECVFGKKTCSQTDSVREMFKNIPIVDVFLLDISEKATDWKVEEAERNTEIDGCQSEKVKAQKYYAWKLLEYGLYRSIGKSIKDVQKNENGKPKLSGGFVSISHSGEIVAVAVSRNEVGIDIETGSLKVSEDSFAKRILTGGELTEIEKVPENEIAHFLISTWTSKEALFKMDNKDKFIPTNYDTSLSKSNLVSDSLVIEGKPILISVATNTPDKVRYFKVTETNGKYSGDIFKNRNGE